MYTPLAKHKVAVIIPFYRHDISTYEGFALQQCFKILGGYPIVAIKPHQFTLPISVSNYPFSSIISFDDAYFASIEGYNTLMLSEEFYKAFLDYEFMLIHQLDAFVFDDQLSYWCNCNYDYIGAPWLKDNSYPDIFKALKSMVNYYFHTRYNVQKNGEPTKYQYENKVGNGGFSLRRVQKFFDLCVENKPAIKKYLAYEGHHFAEDRFWSVEVNRKNKKLNIPDYKMGLKFSFEWSPARALMINQNQLPFGCHAWDRYVDFWKPFFKEIGYDI